jgi:Protein of unknown function (DUF429)
MKKIVGVDFTSAPKRDKKIYVAVCELKQKQLKLTEILEFSDWPAYELWLGEQDSWIGGFDFPFGLPEKFVKQQGWTGTWPEMVTKCVQGGKDKFVLLAMTAFMAAKSVDDKHRQTDLKAGSHSPLKTNTNPPVGRMFYEGAWRLLAYNIHIPALNETASKKIALEAYPGLLAKQIGFRFYKNDKPSNSKKNREARRDILRALYTGEYSLGIKVRMPGAMRERVLTDGSGDLLDSILCATQAAWASEKPRFGIPTNVRHCEGWIVGAR